MTRSLSGLLCRALGLAEKLYPEKSNKVYEIDSPYSSVSLYERIPKEQELVCRHVRIVAHAGLILWSLCTAYLIISNPVYALSL